MRYRYLDDFRHGISVFAIFSYGIAILGTPQMSPSFLSLWEIRTMNEGFTHVHGYCCHGHFSLIYWSSHQ